jgi:hypothetical protein
MPLLLLGAYRGFRRRSSYDRALLVWIVLICVPLLLTLPDNRYFLPAFPAFAAISARALEQRRGVNAPVLALALSLCAVTILYYAQIDLSRPVFLFRAW